MADVTQATGDAVILSRGQCDDKWLHLQCPKVLNDEYRRHPFISGRLAAFFEVLKQADVMSCELLHNIEQIVFNAGDGSTLLSDVLDTLASYYVVLVALTLHGSMSQEDCRLRSISDTIIIDLLHALFFICFSNIEKYDSNNDDANSN